MRTRSFFIVFSLLLVCISCQTPTREAKSCPQEDMLYRLDYYIATEPDSVLQILDTLDVDLLSEKEQAHYCLMKAKVRDMLFLYDAETDSLLQVAENYFVGGKNKYMEADTYKTLAHLAFKKAKGMQYELDWLLKALQCIEQCYHLDPRYIQGHPEPITEQEFIEDYKYYLHYLLGRTYSQGGYKEEGYNHLKTANQHFAKTQNFNIQSRTEYMLGNSYLEKGEYDSCIMCYNNGLDAAEKTSDVEECAYYHYCMSMFYKYKHGHEAYLDAEEKQRLLRQTVTECKKGLALLQESRDKYRDAFYSGLSNTYYYLKEYDSCIYFAKKEMELILKVHSEMTPNDMHAGIIYRIYKSYEALGDADNALLYANMYLTMQQQLKQEPQALEQVKNEYDKKMEMIQLQSEQQAKRYRLFLLLALTLLVLMLVLWLTFRYRKNKELEALRFLEANRQLQSKLELASQQSQQILHQRAMNLYKTEDDKAWEHILAEFETAYPQVMEKLKAAHPDLTESECNIIILSFLGFRTKEEAEILNLSLNTVEKYRTNIRKKAGSDLILHLIR